MYHTGIYLPPNTRLAGFTTFIIDTLAYRDNCCTLFAGDLNIEVLCNSNAMHNYIDTFHLYCLTKGINLPTYFLNNNCIATTLMDNLRHILNCPKKS